MKQKVFGVVVAVLAAAAQIAGAHHGGDPTDELPLWQLLAVGAIVVAGFLIGRTLRKLRRPPTAAGTGERDRAG